MFSVFLGGSSSCKISNLNCDFVNARDARATKHENSLLSRMNDFEINSTICQWQQIEFSLERRQLKFHEKFICRVLRKAVRKVIGLSFRSVYI